MLIAKNQHLSAQFVDTFLYLLDRIKEKPEKTNAPAVVYWSCFGTLVSSLTEATKLSIKRAEPIINDLLSMVPSLNAGS